MHHHSTGVVGPFIQTQKHQTNTQQGPTFEEMLAAVLPLYKGLLQAIAALGFPLSPAVVCDVYMWVWVRVRGA